IGPVAETSGVCQCPEGQARCERASVYSQYTTRSRQPDPGKTWPDHRQTLCTPCRVAQYPQARPARNLQAASAPALAARLRLPVTLTHSAGVIEAVKIDGSYRSQCPARQVDTVIK